MSLRPRDRIALVALVLLALVGAYYMLVLTPERHKVTALNAMIATQQQALAKAQDQTAAGQAAVASLRAGAAQYAAIGLAVPTRANIPALLRTLERTANAEHVKMQTISLTGGSSATTSSSSAATSSTSTSSAGGPTVVPVQLTFSGGYLALDDLLRRLDEFVTVSGTDVHATGPLVSVSSVQLSGTPSLTAQLNATIYQLPASSTSTGATTTTGAQ